MPNRNKIFLVGLMKHHITGSNYLPSIGNCLRVLFYNMRISNMSLSDSATLVIHECIIFWKTARIPSREIHKY